jgi:putative spermidine/putrescine transport system substrate-binding protein
MKIAFVVLIAFLLAELNAVHANDITVISFGRADQAALTKAYYRPFREATGIDVKSFSYDGQTTELEKMAKTGKTVWDVIQVESRTLELGCKQGLFEKLDSTKIGNLGDFIPGAVSECGVGIFAWSTALAYDASKVNGAPSSWADFWDVKKYPGKRGLRRSGKYTLEIGLLADGVAPADVYKVLAVASRSCGVPRPSLAPYVTVTGPTDGADAARRVFMSPVLLQTLSTIISF